jgi:ribonuclease BN (tRNA processing enzyme)
MTVRLQFIGCGDAFGSGGRSQTCFHLSGAGANMLIDCGASSLPALNRFGVDRSAVDLILLTHFHGDHFGGIPFFILDAQFVSRRTRPLVIAGPPGLPAWYARLLNATFPGDRKLSFELTLHEVEIGKANAIGRVTVTPLPVRHDAHVGPCLAHRVAIGDKIIAYSGDTEWTDALHDVARGADLFVCECYTFDRTVPAHLSLSVLRRKLPEIGAKRVILTHMSTDMLARLDQVEYQTAQDGMVVEI